MRENDPLGKDRESSPATGQEEKNRFKKLQMIALIVFVSAILAMIFSADGKISVDSIVSRANGNPLRSAALLLLLFAIKSLTIVVPLASLFVASGMLFSPVQAVMVSYLGMAVTLTLPFILGRWSGTEGIDYVKKKYPKIEKILAIQERNEFFASFIVRVIGWFPCDVISFYFGACRTNYLSYLNSALLGCSIGIITNTLLGDVIMNPFSLEFNLLMLSKILVSAGAIAIAYFMNKEKGS